MQTNMPVYRFVYTLRCAFEGMKEIFMVNLIKNQTMSRLCDPHCGFAGMGSALVMVSTKSDNFRVLSGDLSFVHCLSRGRCGEESPD